MLALRVVVHADERACFRAQRTASVAAPKMRVGVKVLQGTDNEPSTLPQPVNVRGWVN